MKCLQIGFAIVCFFTTSVYATEYSTCQFLPESKQPSWVNSADRDDGYYYAVGGASGKQSDNYLDINNFITKARQDAVNNLASSIRSGIKISTQRMIESKKEGKSKAEIRKEVQQKTEVVSQVALSSVIDDARWLDRKSCLLWYQVKVSKAGAEFAIKAYVNEVAEKLHKKIEQLTHREIEQILSDNGFSATLPDATQALLNNNIAYYRGQTYNIADLYNQSGFDWLNITVDYFYDRRSISYTLVSLNSYHFYSLNNIPTAIVRSNSTSDKQINGLKKLQSFGVDLNQVKVGVGKLYYLNGDYNMIKAGLINIESTDYFEKDGSSYKKEQKAVLQQDIKVPFIYNFRKVIGKEKLGLLHYAIISQKKDLIEPLIKLGVDINQQSVFGYTPLAFAIELGQFTIAQQLLLMGADFTINDYLAYKIAYLFQYGNNHLDSNQISVNSSGTTINEKELANTLDKMNLTNTVLTKVQSEIKNQFPIVLTETTLKKVNGSYSY